MIILCKLEWLGLYCDAVLVDLLLGVDYFHGGVEKVEGRSAVGWLVGW